jgi:pentatricopeptide repeat domain-containing protein 1
MLNTDLGDQRFRLLGDRNARQHRAWQEALKTYLDRKAYGLCPDVFTFSILITACGRSGRWEEALKVFEGMKEDNVAPNTYTYNALISVCEKGGQYEEALKVFEDMKQGNVAPNTITYSALISAYARREGSGRKR